MKIAATSASFGPAMDAGERTQLEWLDACANELEADGVLFELARFPRTDADYVAQLKKTCADLGLSVAGLDANAEPWRDEGAEIFDVALGLGAPLVVAASPRNTDEAGAWSAFSAAAKARARDAKARNVVLAVCDDAGSLCPDGAALQRLAKDVDSSWLRFAPGTGALRICPALLAESVIVLHAVDDVERFGAPGDSEATEVIETLARFRGFLALSLARAPSTRAAYHQAIERFTRARAQALDPAVLQPEAR